MKLTNPVYYSVNTPNLKDRPSFASRLSSTQRYFLEQFVHQGYKDEEIAKLMNKTINWVTCSLRKAGLKPLQSLIKNVGTDRIIYFYKQGFSVQEISHIFNYPEKTVNSIIVRYNRNLTYESNSDELCLRLIKQLKLNQKDIEKSVVFSGETAGVKQTPLSSAKNTLGGLLKNVMDKLNLSEQDLSDKIIL